MRPSRVPVTLSPRARARIRRCAGACGPSTSGRPFCVAGRSRAKFRDYFDWKESVSRAPSHRVLALLRGDAEGVLRVTVEVPEEKALAIMEGHFVRGAGAAAQEARAALRDGFKRLLGPSMESEIRVEVKTRADEEAIRIFASNLTELLLAPPLGNRTALAIDPGFRTGCKVTVLDPQGKLLHHE